MLSFQENPSILENLQADLSPKVEIASLSAATSLIDRISAGTRRGRHYAKYPRRSSASGEYPQEQFGHLVNSVDNVRVDALTYAVGFFGEDMDKLIYLELRGEAGTGKGRRQPLYMHFVGQDSTATLDEMAQALEGSR